MSTKLSVSHFALLNTASQQGDLIVDLPKDAKGSTARKQLAGLLTGGLVKEVKAKAGAAIWRRDEKTKQAFALRLTAAGVKAIASRHHEPAVESEKHAPNANKRKQVTPTNQDVLLNEPSEFDRAATVGDRSTASRGGTKIAKVLELLERASGAHLQELIDVTGWLPHTTRAALTGLRKRGYVVTRNASEGDPGSTYRVVRAAPLSSAMDANTGADSSEHDASKANSRGRSRGRKAA